MCGIAGFWRGDSPESNETTADLKRMADSLAHRGPDDEGCWYEPRASIAFCHRRLSILDLSPLGHQPMHSASGRFTITLNGEIYNYRQLRSELARLGHTFRGSSDTEVLLAAIEQWGVHETLERCSGMFAFGLWDNSQQTLYLARDRFGEKPLYYGQLGETFAFASELKALRAHSAWAADIDRNALALLLRYSFIPAPHSIFRNIHKLHPGRFLVVSRRGNTFDCRELSYWEPRELVERWIADSLTEPSNDQQILDTIDDALTEATRRQMVADVPIGAFLSGGIDSSLIVSIMQGLSSQPVRTFSIGFWEDEFNEAPFAKAVASHLGTNHTELTVAPADALAVIPRLPRIFDEPFADSSQIPTFLVSKLAREAVTVSLSGDGGDELFGGYTRYPEALSQWRSTSRVPATLRSPSGRLIERLPLEALSVIALPTMASKRFRGRPDLADRLKERAASWQATTIAQSYHAKISQWQQPTDVVVDSLEPPAPVTSSEFAPRNVDDLRRMMYTDMCMYLPDDILTKVDRAAMAVGLETRVPLLDPAVAAAAWRAPAVLHWKDGKGKWILRRLLERRVPKQLVDRPKRGFAVPMAKWLRQELRPWASDLLDSQRLRREGFFDARHVERRWNQHLTGSTDWSFHLWSVLMFQAWLDAWR